MSKTKKAKKKATPLDVVTTVAPEPNDETEPVGIPCRKCGHLITRPFGVIENGRQRRVCRNPRCLCTFWADHRKGYVFPKKSCCPECGSNNTTQYSTKPGQQYRECRACGHKYTETGQLI